MLSGKQVKCSHEFEKLDSQRRSCSVNERVRKRIKKKHICMYVAAFIYVLLGFNLLQLKLLLAYTIVTGLINSLLFIKKELKFFSPTTVRYGPHQAFFFVIINLNRLFCRAHIIATVVYARKQLAWSDINSYNQN